MSQFKKNGTMELETSIGYSFSLIKTEYKQNKIYQNKKKTKRTVNLSFQSALCQQSETCRRQQVFISIADIFCVFEETKSRHTISGGLFNRGRYSGFELSPLVMIICIEVNW